MATMDEVRAILSSNADPSKKLDRLAALVFAPAPEPEPPKPRRAAKVEPAPERETA